MAAPLECIPLDSLPGSVAHHSGGVGADGGGLAAAAPRGVRRRRVVHAVGGRLRQGALGGSGEGTDVGVQCSGGRGCWGGPVGGSVGGHRRRRRRRSSSSRRSRSGVLWLLRRRLLLLVVLLLHDAIGGCLPHEVLLVGNGGVAASHGVVHGVGNGHACKGSRGEQEQDTHTN